MKRLVFVAGVVWSLAGTARADQCQVVDRETATWAARVITPGSIVATFCAPCGDRTPKPPTEVKKVTVDAAGTHVSINGTVVDLAYVYLQTGKATWTNVAFMIGCATTGVDPFVSPHDTLTQLSADLDALDKRVSAAVDAVVAAQNEADRAAAKATLQQLQKDKAALEARIAAAKAAAARAAREKGVRVSKECLENPLAKGCQ